MHLFWGVREYEHFYFEKEAIAVGLKSIVIFIFTRWLRLPEAQWKGDKGYVHHAVLNAFDDLSEFDIYVVGRFEMAKIAREDFVKKGALVEHIYGDAFAFI